MSKLRAHIFVLSWPAVAENVAAMIAALAPVEARKTVIDTSRALACDLTGWEYIGIAADSLFGRQMELAVRLFDGDVFICINGDVHCNDWAELVTRCVARFDAVPQIGVWSPNIENTGWMTALVSLGLTTDPMLHVVAQTGAFVWALRPAVVERFCALGLFANNIGWGIDWVGMVAAYSNGLVAVRDQTVSVDRLITAEVSPDGAHEQMLALFEELTGAERALLCLLHRALGIGMPFEYRIP